MRIDAELLERVTRCSDKYFLRIYTWQEPTISLGYFQSLDDVPEGPLGDCPRVKRLSGGGAILHDQEVTYSIALPACHAVCRSPRGLYDKVHQSIIGLLSRMEIDCEIRRFSKHPTSSGDANAFLCFQRADPHDVLLCGQKIVGSAQRRRRGSILQHGSILVRSSLLAPEIQGIENMRPFFDVPHFHERLSGAINESLAVPE